MPYVQSWKCFDCFLSLQHAAVFACPRKFALACKSKYADTFVQYTKVVILKPRDLVQLGQVQDFSVCNCFMLKDTSNPPPPRYSLMLAAYWPLCEKSAIFLDAALPSS
jgi:hypothetical protein